MLLSFNNSYIKHVIKMLQFKYFPQGFNYYKIHTAMNQSLHEWGLKLLRTSGREKGFMTTEIAFNYSKVSWNTVLALDLLSH